MEHFLTEYIQQGIKDRLELLKCQEVRSAVKAAAESVLTCFRNGGKLMLAGNGGSAADSQHIAAEFVSRFKFDRPGLPAIALTTDTSALTAIGNDYGFDQVFRRQLQAVGSKGDVFIAITTSGKSKNIVEAMSYAVAAGIKTVLFTGDNDVQFSPEITVIRVPSRQTCFMQEMHISIGHYICDFTEQSLF